MQHHAGGRWRQHQLQRAAIIPRKPFSHNFTVLSVYTGLTVCKTRRPSGTATARAPNQYQTYNECDYGRAIFDLRQNPPRFVYEKSQVRPIGQ